MTELSVEFLLGAIAVILLFCAAQLNTLREDVSKIRKHIGFLADNALPKERFSARLRSIDSQTEISAENLGKIERRMDQFTKSDSEQFVEKIGEIFEQSSKKSD